MNKQNYQNFSSETHIRLKFTKLVDYFKENASSIKSLCSVPVGDVANYTVYRHIV